MKKYITAFLFSLIAMTSSACTMANPQPETEGVIDTAMAEVYASCAGVYSGVAELDAASADGAMSAAQNFYNAALLGIDEDLAQMRAQTSHNAIVSGAANVQGEAMLCFGFAAAAAQSLHENQVAIVKQE